MLLFECTIRQATLGSSLPRSVSEATSGSLIERLEYQRAMAQSINLLSEKLSDYNLCWIQVLQYSTIFICVMKAVDFFFDLFFIKNTWFSCSFISEKLIIISDASKESGKSWVTLTGLCCPVHARNNLVCYGTMCVCLSKQLACEGKA